MVDIILLKECFFYVISGGGKGEGITKFLCLSLCEREKAPLRSEILPLHCVQGQNDRGWWGEKGALALP